MATAQFRINLIVKRNNLLIVNESDDCVSRNSLDFLIEDGAKIPTEAPAQKMLDGHSTSSRSDDRTSIGWSNIFFYNDCYYFTYYTFKCYSVEVAIVQLAYYFPKLKIKFLLL